VLARQTFWVTGATGRLGCEVTGRLEQLGARPVPLVLEGYPTAPRRWTWTAAAEPVAVATADDLASLPPPDHVLNLHWCVDRELTEEDELLHDIDHNIRRPAFLWMWLAGSGCRRFVNVSSTKVFSSLNLSPVSSATDPRPTSAYGLAKLTGERYFDARFRGTSVVPIHVRLCTLAAAGGHPSQLMPRLCDSAFSDRPVEVNRSHRVHIVHIAEATDLVIASALTLERGPIVVAPPSASVGQIASAFEAQADVSLNATYVDRTSAEAEPELRPNTESLYSDWTRHYSLDELVGAIAREHRNQMDPAPIP
jgi:nucleoside-diphosphate-sugar epimerase